MEEFISSMSSTETRSSYFRQMALAIFDALIVPAVQIGDVILGYRKLNAPFVFSYPWKLIHSDWTPITVPESEWTRFPWLVLAIKQMEWLNPILAVIFFAFFGTTVEARKLYKRALGSILGMVGLGTLKRKITMSLGVRVSGNTLENIVFASNGQM